MKYSTIKYGLTFLLGFVTQLLWAGHEKGIESFRGNAIFTAAQSSTYDISTGDITNKDQALYLDIMDHSYRTVRYNPNWNALLNLSEITNDVVLRFDDYQRLEFDADWKIKVEYTLYFNTDEDFDHYEVGELEITYDDASHYIDQQRKVFNTFGGAVQDYAGLNPRLYIRDVSIIGSPTDQTLIQTGDLDLFVDLELHSEKCYILQGDNLLVNVTDQNQYTFANTTDYDYAQINWAYVEGAESYELEWLFVDLGLPTDPTLTIGSSLTDYPNFNYDFENAFGITLQENTFNIPLHFPTGILLYRVRAVGYSNDCATVAYGDWSSPLTKGQIHNLNSADYLVINGFESDKTWQSSSTFIEGGKHADAITYYDGSLTGRQSIAVNKEANIGVVNTPVYDYSGRATLNLAPFAVEDNSLKYKTNVTQYPKASFDATATIGNPLDYTSATNEISASKYYSAGNSFDHTHKEYIPDAGNQPFSRTLIKNDGTNRIKEQSGMGPNYQIGSDKTTKYYYQKPSQYELDILFGNEVGYAENYSKEIVVDANGQGTYIIKDKNGQVIVSGLYGDAPSNLDALPNALTAQLEQVELDISNQNFQNLHSTDVNHHFDIATATSFSNLYYDYNLSVPNPDITFESDIYPDPNSANTNPAYDYNVTRSFDLSLQINDQNGVPVSSIVTQTGITTANLNYPSTGSLQSGSYTYHKQLSLNDPLSTVLNDFESSQTIISQNDFQIDYQPCGCDEDCIGSQMNDGYWYVPVSQSSNYHPNGGSGYVVDINGGDYYIINKNTNLFLNYTQLNTSNPFKNQTGTYSGVTAFVDNVEHCQYSCDFPSGEVFSGFSKLVNQVYPGSGALWNLVEVVPPIPPTSPISPYAFWDAQSDIFALVDENNVAITSFSSGITGATQLDKLADFSTNVWIDNSFWDGFENQWFKVDNPYEDENGYLTPLVLPLNREYYLKYILLPKHPEFDLLNNLFTADFTTYYNDLSNNTVFVPSTALGSLASSASGYFSSYAINDPLSLTSSTVTYSGLPTHPNATITYPTGIYTISSVLDNISGLSIYEFMDNDPSIPTSLKNKFHGSNIAPYHKGLFNTSLSKEAFFEQLYIDLRTTKYLASYFSVNSLFNVTDDIVAGLAYDDFVDLKPVVDADYVWANIDVNLIELSATSPDFGPYFDAKYPESTDPASLFKKSLKDWFKENVYVEPQSFLASEFFSNYSFTSDMVQYIDLQSALSGLLYNKYYESINTYLDQLTIVHASGDLYDITLNGGTTISFDLANAEVSLFSNNPAATNIVFNDFKAYVEGLDLVNDVIANNSTLFSDYNTLQASCSTHLATTSISTYITNCTLARAEDIKVDFLSDDIFVYHYYNNPSLDVFDNSLGCAYLEHDADNYKSFALEDMLVDCHCDAIKTMAMNITGASNINDIVPADFTTSVNTQILENLGFSGAALTSAEPIFATHIVNPSTSGSCFNAYISVNNLDLIDNDLIYDLLCTPYAMQSSTPCTPLTPAEISALNQDLFESALVDLTLEFTDWYNTHKFDEVNETIIYHFPQKQYQQTLFYYDLNGNLIKTVPPEFLDLLEPWELVDVEDYRSNPQGATPFTKPNYQGKETTYTYNSLNQLVTKNSPELLGDQLYHYDLTGRLIASQSPEQKLQMVNQHVMQYTQTREMFSYTLFDDLGRVKESGVAEGDYSNLSADYDLFEAHVLTLNRREVNIPHYDDPVPSSVVLPFDQQFLRNRVSWTEYYPIHPGMSSAAMINDDKYYRDAYSKQYYSYDVHGNVNQYFVEHRASAVSSISKHMSYTYDLISGNVIEFAYQPGEVDAFYHRYYYDESNRLIEAESSNDRTIWETEAKYFYYPHGPLARVELGDKQVQGMDYAYTLHGWLKSVNGVSNDRSLDMGLDGQGGSVVNRNAEFAEDELSYKIDYFNGDYSPIGNVGNGVSTFEGNASLYNGNISAIRYDISDLDPVNYKYRYDQLQRLTVMESFNNLGAFSGYKSELTYDGNGNIQTLKRYQGESGNTLMDDINYTYLNGSNQLNYAIDVIDDPDVEDDYFSPLNGSGGNDVTNETYYYDRVGNEIYKFALREFYDGYRSNRWFFSGKVKSTAHAFSDGVNNDDNPWRLNFFYDGGGQRVAKVLKIANDDGVIIDYNQNLFFPETEFEDKFEDENTYTYTYYITDPTGNTIATYKHRFENASAVQDTLIETVDHFNIYGSSRLGTSNKNIETKRWLVKLSSTGTDMFSSSTKLFDITQIDFVPLSIPTPSLDVFSRVLGRKNYELSNHLGNVLTTVSDRKKKNTVSSGILGYYKSDVKSSSDYYPFGMQMPGRKFDTPKYRYGFGGHEKDDEVKGEGNHLNFGGYGLDVRIGRRYQIDPMVHTFPSQSPYMTFFNNPIIMADPTGMSPCPPGDPDCGQDPLANYDERLQEGMVARAKEYVSSAWNFVKKIFDDPKGASMDVGRTVVNTAQGVVNLAQDPIGTTSNVIEATQERIANAEDPVKEMGGLQLDGAALATTASFSGANLGSLVRSVKKPKLKVVRTVSESGPSKNVALGQKLKQDLAFREKSGLFTSLGNLKAEVINKSTKIINATQLKNEALKAALKAEGGHLADWNKMSYSTGGSRGVDIHYYYNSVTEKAYYGLDYKTKLGGSYLKKTP